MTICNMTIEGGGRAGMIAPDETTFEYVERPPGRPGGLRRRGRALARAAHRRRRELRHRGRDRRRGALADGHLGHDPGHGRRGHRRGARPAALDGPVDRETAERALAYMALEPGHADDARSRSTASSSARARTRGSRTCARPPRWSTAARSPRAVRGDGRPGLAAGEGAGRGGGPRRGLPRRRLRVARAGLLDVPGHEPRHPPARASAAPRPRTATSRAARAAAGAPTSSARRWPPPPRSRATSSTSGSGAEAAMDADRRHRGQRSSVLDRADVDTDQIIPKQFLKRVERTGFGEFLFYDWIRAGEIELEPNPILVAGPQLRLRSSREHAPWALEDYGFEASSRRRSPTSSTRTARRSACCR